MNRREPVSKGYVNFPINDPSYTHTAEGGMLVKLYVINDKWDDINDKWDDPDSFEICCGAVVTDALNASMIGSDRITLPQFPDNPDSCAIDQYLKEEYSLHEQYYPNINNENVKDSSRFLSIPLLAAIVLGNTGWSGWNSKSYWKCSYDDLTDDGKALYNSIQTLYGKHASLHLLTFLDT